MYDKETKVYTFKGIGSWIIMGLATIGIISIIQFFYEVNKIH